MLDQTDTMDRSHTQVYLPVPDLGTGAGLMLWGFRACVAGHVQCPALVRLFARSLGSQADYVRQSLLVLSQAIGCDGHRRLTVNGPGQIEATADELSFLAALAAAQCGDEPLRDAHLTWLMVRPPNESAVKAAAATAQALMQAGYLITMPEVGISAPHPHVTDGRITVVHEEAAIS